METADLPINIASWLLALAPIVVLLAMLAVLRWKAPQAAMKAVNSSWLRSSERCRRITRIQVRRRR